MFSGISRGIPSFGDLSWKSPVDAVFTSTLPSYTRSGNVLTASANGALPNADDYALSVGERVLVWIESGGNSANNGIYTVTDLGSAGTKWVLTRSTDCDIAREAVPGTAISVLNGTRNDRQVFIATANPWTLNSTDPDFRPIGAPWYANAQRFRKPATISTYDVSIEEGSLSVRQTVGDAFARVSLVGGAVLNGMRLGAGGASSPDIDILRTAAITLTMDDTAGGGIIQQLRGRLALSSGTERITNTGTFDYALADTTSILQWNGGGAGTLAGIARGSITDGRLLFVQNITTGQTLTIAHESGSASSSVRRIICPGGANVSLTNRRGAILIYDSTDSRWRVTSLA